MGGAATFELRQGLEVDAVGGGVQEVLRIGQQEQAAVAVVVLLWESAHALCGDSVRREAEALLVRVGLRPLLGNAGSVGLRQLPHAHSLQHPD